MLKLSHLPSSFLISPNLSLCLLFFFLVLHSFYATGNTSASCPNCGHNSLIVTKAGVPRPGAAANVRKTLAATAAGSRDVVLEVPAAFKCGETLALKHTTAPLTAVGSRMPGSPPDGFKLRDKPTCA